MVLPIKQNSPISKQVFNLYISHPMEIPMTHFFIFIICDEAKDPPRMLSLARDYTDSNVLTDYHTMSRETCVEIMMLEMCWDFNLKLFLKL